MKQKILLAVIYLTVSLSFSQTKKYFLVGKEIDVLKPTYEIENNGRKLHKFNDQKITTFFENFVVTQFENEFSNFKSDFLKRVYTISLENDANLNEALSVFVPYIEYYEEIGQAELASNIEPNDYLLYPWDRQKRNDYLDLINAPMAWSITKGDPNILIGISDSYVSETHEDLQGKIVTTLGSNVPPTWNPTYLTHGTATAYLAAGVTNNEKGGSSIGFNTKLAVNNTINTFGYNSVKELSEIPNVKVINMSWVHNWSSSVEDSLYSAIHNEKNILLVAAAGNQHYGSATNYLYPASYKDVISVGAVGSRFERGTDDPLWGTYSWEDIALTHPEVPNSTMTYNDKINVVAPGFGLWLADFREVVKENNEIVLENGYNDWGDGTSSASPIVSGLGALIFAANPNLTASQVKSIIESTTDNIYQHALNQPYIGKLGTGRINAFRAVKTADCMINPNNQLDLIIRDNYEDVGQQPNLSTEVLYESVDMWIRNQNDGKDIRKSENPIYQGPGSKVYVYVRVTNNSCVTSSGTESLQLYWAKAATSLDWPQGWNGSVQINNTPMGGLLNTLNIPSLKPGEDTIIEFEWIIPNPALYENINQEPWHFCLLSRINTLSDPMFITENLYLPINVKNNNNLAWRNVSILNISENNNNQNSYSSVILVGNPQKFTRQTKFRFFEDSESNNLIDFAKVKVKFSAEIQNKITSNTILKNVQYNRADKSYLIRTKDASIENISLEPNEFGTITFEVNFFSENTTDKNSFDFKIEQYDQNGLVGGEVFKVNKQFNRDIKSRIELDNSFGNPKLKSEFEYPNTEYNWYDVNGNLLHSGVDFLIDNSFVQTYILELKSKEDGFIDFSEINLNNDQVTNGLIIYPNPGNSIVNIEYNVTNGSSCLLVTKVDNTLSNNYILDPTQNIKQLDVSNYPNGYYLFSLINNNQVIKTGLFLKE